MLDSHSKAIESVFDEIPTSYPFQFQIATEDNSNYNDDVYLALIPPFTTFLKKTPNLVEITLKTFALSEDAMESELHENEAKSFFAAFKDYSAVRKITVLSGTSFTKFCRLLGEEENFPFPNLERITYTSGFRDDEFTSDSHDCLQRMLKNRAEASLKPLLELEIKRFPPVESEVLAQIGELGIQLIQGKEKYPRSFNDSDSGSGSEED